MVSRYINLLTDFGFKKIFGTDLNKDLLIDFLNQILPKRHQITDLTYTKNEQLGPNIIDRKAIFDLNCISNNNQRFIVEVQQISHEHFKNRLLYYSTFPVQEQAVKGKGWDYKLAPVYVIAILNFEIDDYVSPKHYRLVELIDKESVRTVEDNLKFIYIELPKFEKSLEGLKTHFEKWLYVFRYLSKLNRKPSSFRASIFNRLFEAVSISAFTPAEQASYQASLKTYLDHKIHIDEASQKGRTEGLEEGLKKGLEEGLKKGLEKGLKEGEEKGLEKGLKEGEEKGLEKGLKEGLKKGKEKGLKHSVIELYKNGIDISIISKSLNISEEKVKQILETS